MSVDTATKRSLREKKSKKNHLEARFNDYDSFINNPNAKSKPLSEGAKKCMALIQKLKKHPSGYPFLYPVEESMAPGYSLVIKEPMDLWTVEKNLRNNVYASTIDFASDIRKIWNNAYTYNQKGSELYFMTNEMSAHFEKLYKDIENVSLSGNLQHLQKKVESLSRELKELRSQRGSTKGQAAPKTSKGAAYLQKPMTMAEKKQLGHMITNLPAEYLRGVWQIVSQGAPELRTDQEELEFDIDSLPVQKLRELEKYAKSKMTIVQRKQSKKKPSSSTLDVLSQNSRADSPKYSSSVKSLIFYALLNFHVLYRSMHPFIQIMITLTMNSTQHLAFMEVPQSLTQNRNTTMNLMIRTVILLSLQVL